MSVFDLLKSHVDAYTRKDGVTVTAHDDKRVAAQPNLGAVAAKHHDAFDRKASDWNGTGKKIPASDIPSGAPEFSHKEVYGHDRTTSPAGDDFADGFKPPQHFVVKHNDGSRNLVNTEGYGYARYHAAIDGEKAGAPAASKSDTPGIGTHAKALRASSKPGDLDHEDNQVAADHMEAGDHKALTKHLKHLDTAARDHILEHIHPEHSAGLGFEKLNMERSKKQYAEKFDGKAKASAKPAEKMSAQDALRHPDHKSVVAAASRGEFDMQHAAEKAALETGAKPTDKKKAKPAAPAEGEAGHEEFNKYGAYFKKGDKVKDNYGKPHEVLSHRGPEVHTTGGSYHPTKLHRA